MNFTPRSHTARVLCKATRPNCVSLRSTGYLELCVIFCWSGMLVPYSKGSTGRVDSESTETSRGSRIDGYSNINLVGMPLVYRAP
ncbi:unnamed protein product [Larinioides sclopetarius]|uniref:Uncharacterized protein n=1 Tax=Larinioides sclopetarius TaxID=280406 RepID=A0AAV1YXS6_9ARAC